MSVQFGRWNLDGKPVEPTYLAKVKQVIGNYGPDDAGAYTIPNLSILYHAFHITEESRREAQPHVSETGVVITWDGRLDNRAELIHRLGNVPVSATDVSLVAAAYEQSGTSCFPELVGDWAISVWDARSRSLILAKDPIGTRHLYYSLEMDRVTWSTVLDPLVLLAGRTFAIDEEYIAGWLSSFPASHLTPYVDIQSVPPACFVEFTRESRRLRRYWVFDPSKTIRYDKDEEYEEHFRAVFTEAVRKRLRADRPVLAELSGGMDSSAIVCIADRIMERETAPTPRIDTLSYYNDSEPNWNEQPYFTKIEERRGRVGCHIDLGSNNQSGFGFAGNCFPATPYSAELHSNAGQQFAKCLAAQGNRVVLSGIGGDEVTGGVPTPMPELMDLIAGAQFKLITRQLKAWALNKRRPWLLLLLEASRGFFPPTIVGIPQHLQAPEWLQDGFMKRHPCALSGYLKRIKLFGPLPSFQENRSTFEGLQRQLENSPLSCRPLYENRYPYLDRDLLEFMLSIPREQVVRPGERRSLMRRALKGIVPEEVLNRKRKAFAVRAPTTEITHQWKSLSDENPHMVSDLLGFVDSTKFRATVEKIRQGREISSVTALRTLRVELWLRALRQRYSSKIRFPGFPWGLMETDEGDQQALLERANGVEAEKPQKMAFTV